MSRWRFDMRTLLAVTSQRTNTKRKERETSKSTKEDQKQQMKNKLASGGRQYDLSKKLRTTSISSDPYDALEHHVRDETPSRPGPVLVQK